MKWRWWIICVVLSVFAQEAEAGQRLALVVGNQRYPDNSQGEHLFGTLVNSKNDAKDMAAQLERFGFQVTLALDVDEDGLDKAITDFIKMLKEQQPEAALFFFSGHGAQVENENYLVPVDRRFRDQHDIRKYAPNANLLLTKMTDTKTPVNIMILDACRSEQEEATHDDAKGAETRTIKSGLTVMTPSANAAGAIIAYAAAPDSIAKENPHGRNSHYTASLLEAMRTSSDLPIEQVFKYTHEPVYNMTNGLQTPWENNGLRGDFCFAECRSARPTPTPDVAQALADKAAQEIAGGNDEQARHLIETLKIWQYDPKKTRALEAKLSQPTPTPKPVILSTPTPNEAQQLAEDELRSLTDRAWRAIFDGKLTETKALIEELKRTFPDAPQILALEEGLKTYPTMPKQVDTPEPVISNTPTPEQQIALLKLNQAYEVLEQNTALTEIRAMLQDVQTAIAIQSEQQPTQPANMLASTSSVSCWDNETPGATCKEEITGMEFIYVPGGCFTMGEGDPEIYESYKVLKKNFKWDPLNDAGYAMLFGTSMPRHNVCINKGFLIGKYEVTQAQWEIVMKNNPSNFKGATRPVESVSWNDAQVFLQKLNAINGNSNPFQYRLPSETEWEYAARAGTRTAYSFGDDPNWLGKYAWYRDNSNNETHSVGKKIPNAFGLYDMHGNVAEWVADTYLYENELNDVFGETLKDKKRKVLRGGAWNSSNSGCLSAYRTWSYAFTGQFIDVGFRVVVSRTQ